jgi:hypothetical protein
MAEYGRFSPWANTLQNSLYLETLNYRQIPNSVEDTDYTIENQYTHRPDLLAYDMYGDVKLWWVFMARNRSIIQDPVFDFQPGITIKCPKKEPLIAALGKRF